MEEQHDPNRSRACVRGRDNSTSSAWSGDALVWKQGWHIYGDYWLRVFVRSVDSCGSYMRNTLHGKLRQQQVVQVVAIVYAGVTSTGFLVAIYWDQTKELEKWKKGVVLGMVIGFQTILLFVLKFFFFSFVI